MSVQTGGGNTFSSEDTALVLMTTSSGPNAVVVTRVHCKCSKQRYTRREVADQHMQCNIMGIYLNCLSKKSMGTQGILCEYTAPGVGTR